jgi:hypothetical protein
MAPGKHADQHVVDDFPVPDDDLLDLGPQCLEGGDELLNPSFLGHQRLLSASDASCTCDDSMAEARGLPDF